MQLNKLVTDKIDAWVLRYPKEGAQSALMQALRYAQEDNHNVLTHDHIKAVAEHLGVPTISALEVATFYENYNVEGTPHTHQIRFCHNISCMLRGSDELIAYLEQKLNIKVGEVTSDGKFQLKKVECLGACTGAPMMQIGDTYYEYLDTDKLDIILENL